MKKFVKLAAAANPNILELLYIPEEHHIFVHDMFKLLLESRDLFLSKKARHSYSGYAFSQVNKCKSHSKHGTLREKYKSGSDLDPYDCKYAAHTCRLIMNGAEILKSQTLTPSFTGEHLELLKKIRAGKYFKNAQEFYDFIWDTDTKMSKLYDASTLRHSPDFDKINEVLINIHERMFSE